MIDMSNMQTRMKKTSAKSTFSNKDPRLSQSIHYAILRRVADLELRTNDLYENLIE